MGQYSDYRAFAETPCNVASTGSFDSTQPATFATNQIANAGFFHIICLADASLTSVVFKWPALGLTPDAAISLKAGAQLGGVKSFTIASGQVQFLYFY